MSIDHLLDHTCTIFVFSEGTDSIGAAVNTYVAGAEEPLALAPAPLPGEQADAGMIDRGMQAGYMRAGVQVKRNDVLDITAGPMAPLRMRVSGMPQRPSRRMGVQGASGHHTELVLEPFDGHLPGDAQP